ncbi:hypothetical protein [Nonomuraea cavernae]|uniref:hypothetical protein n=1 Tax=Nonomuraea cavernae TaxID=2045107 RepID=UPI003408AAE4
MKLLLSIMVAGSAVLLTSAPAQAAPKDPVKAVKAQLVSGHGVRFSETVKQVVDGKSSAVVRRSGTLQFGKGKVVASDVTGRFATGKREKPERTITIGRTSWTTGGLYQSGLPKGKTWYKQPGVVASGAITGLVSQVVNPAEPSTLAALVKKGERGTSGYSGTLTFEELGKVSPSFRAGATPIFTTPETDVRYNLTLDRKGLPSRLSTSWQATGLSAGGEDRTYKVETRYTGWGAKVSIKPPPAAKTASKLTR